jgi:hypothetical protein
MDSGIGEGCDGVSDERREEDERHNGVRQVIVVFELYLRSEAFTMVSNIS